MTSCINIADFRCRATARALSFANRPSRRLRGFEIVQPRGSWPEWDPRMLQGAVVREDPTVYDIGIAREVQLMRHRAVFRPISIQRKAKVLRFRSQEPVSIRMRAEERRAVESGMPDGPYDFPPAA